MAGLNKAFWDIVSRPMNLTELKVGDTFWFEQGALRSMRRVTGWEGDTMTSDLVLVDEYESVPRPRVVVVAS